MNRKFKQRGNEMKGSQGIVGTEGVENGQFESTSFPGIPAWEGMLVVAFLSVLSVRSPFELASAFIF